MRNKLKAFICWCDGAFLYLFFALLFGFFYGLLPNTDGFSEVFGIISDQFFWHGVFFGVAFYCVIEFLVSIVFLLIPAHGARRNKKSIG